MKTHLIFLLTAVLLAVGCSGDDFDIVSGDGSMEGAEALVPSSFNFDDPDTSEDNIANTTFDRVISIKFGGSQATVSGDANGLVTVSGNRVTVNNTTSEKIVYELSGTASDGFFKLYSLKKQAIKLNGLNLTNPAGAAINNQSKKRTFIVVEGSNTLADGASYSVTTSGEDEKAALFSEGQLIFCGTGSLTVTATGKAGITSDDYVRFMSSPTVKVTSSAGHAVRGKDAVIVSAGEITAAASADMKKGFSSDSLVCFDGGATVINVTGSVAYDNEDGEYTGTAGIKADKLFEMLGGTLTITNSGAGGKGISCDGDGFFKGGTVSVTTTGSSRNSVSAKGIKFDGNLSFSGSAVSVSCKSHEGIESKGTIDITGGMVYSCAGDDAINVGSHLTVSGGYVCAWSTGNDGLDANGNCYIKGGVVYAIGSHAPEVAVDANTEKGYKLYVEGGTLVAIGGIENGVQLSQSCYSASWNKNTLYALTVGNSSFAFKTPASAGNTLVVSAASEPTLKTGVNVSGGTSLFDGLAVDGGTVSGGSSVKLSNYTGGGGGGAWPPGWH